MRDELVLTPIRSKLSEAPLDRPSLKKLNGAFMPLTAIPTIAVFPEEKLTLDQKIEKWVWQYCRSLEQN